jgi:hypothetical protein
MEEIGKDPGDVFCEKFGSGCGEGRQKGTAIARTLAETVPKHESSGLDNGSSHEILSASWSAKNGRMASGRV